MPKKTHSLRFEDRTWSQLEELQDWLQVGNRTKVIEVLAEQESAKKSFNSQKQIDSWLREKYSIGSEVEIDHPNGEGKKSATITSLTTDSMRSSLANGVMVQFADGTYIDVPFGYLQ